MLDKTLDAFVVEHSERLREIDIQFAQFCFELCGNQETAILSLLISQQLGCGNVCLDISQTNELVSNEQINGLFESAKQCLIEYPDLPIRIEGQRAYLQRYYAYEDFVSDAILQRCDAPHTDLDGQANFLAALFPDSQNSADIDWQKVAVSIAAQSSFTVISGGPGTGKTTTVIRLLALLVNQYKTHNRVPIIKLAAPTGKAAMRLTESIGQAKDRLQADKAIKQTIPEDAFTLHRLLKRNRHGTFYYHQHNPLHVDVLVVDEASMIDLPMMAKLLAALPDHAQLILLGDKDQLASVEAGSVLADICDSNTHHGYSIDYIDRISQVSGIDKRKLEAVALEDSGAAIRHHICHLRKSHRFSEDSGIAALAKAANEADYDQWQRAVANDYDDVNLLSLEPANFAAFIKQSTQSFSKYQDLISPEDNSDETVKAIHDCFNQFRILCAVKEGDFGVLGINRAIEQSLGFDDQWYPGRPVMIQQNDYGLNLYNGDVGIAVPKLVGDETQLRVAFLTSSQEVRWLQPARLPQHETVYAMSVHKSQGSEFQHCALILPDYPVPVLTKELLYTGITRAKTRLTLLAHDKLIDYSLRNRVQRASGLRDRLWQVTECVKSPETEQFSLF